MKKLLKQTAIFAVVLGLASVIGYESAFAADPTVGSASDAGSSLYEDLTANLTGTVGTTVGLLISLVGLYMWIWNQVSWGIFVAIGGALLTAFPGIYSNLTEGAKDAFSSTIKKSGN